MDSLETSKQKCQIIQQKIATSQARLDLLIEEKEKQITFSELQYGYSGN